MPLERVQHIANFRADLRAFLRDSEEIARRWKLTPQRYLLLLMIKGAADGSERLSLGDLAQRLQLSPNTVSELVDRAVASGLVAREPAEHDARVVHVRLTAEGERRLAGALLDSDGFRAELVDAFAELADSLKIAARIRQRPAG